MEQLEELRQRKLVRDQDYINLVRTMLAQYLHGKRSLINDESMSSQSSNSSYLSSRSKSPLSMSFQEERNCKKSLSSQDVSLTLPCSKSTIFPQVPSLPLLLSLPFTDEEIQFIEMGFKSLISRLECTNGVKNGKNPQVFVENVRQFWLSGYAVTERILGVLMEPMVGYSWVSFNRFKHSVERVFFLSDPRKDLSAHSQWRSNFLIFKLLCTFYSVFFKLLSYSDTIHTSELPIVFSLALKSTSVNPAAAAKRITAKIDENRGFLCDVIKMKELFEALTGK